MVDTNKPVAWRVIDRKTNKVIGEFPTSDAALAKCNEFEPGYTHHYRYIMEPVRSPPISSNHRGTE